MWLSRLAEQTTKAIVGTATLILPIYQPPVLAKQIADLDRVSGGRVALGIGVGGEYPADFEAAGVPISGRGARANESIELLRRFWTGEPVDHSGSYFHYDGLRIHPPPEQKSGPPIYVSGRQPAAMRRAANLGDGWMPYLYSPERYARSVDQIGELAAASGRDLSGFSWLVYLMVAVDTSREAARKAATGFFQGTYRQDLSEMLDHIAVVGTVDDVGERLSQYVGAGAEHLIVCPINGDRTAVAESLLTEVGPAL